MRCCRTTAGCPLPDKPDASRDVSVPFTRVAGWIERYDVRHPDTRWTIQPDVVRADSPDGSTAGFAVPFGPLRQPDLTGLQAHLGRPWQLGVILVRRGGFAVAHVVGPDPVELKIGKRHVQGRTKAGGWSQHRFARRRDNQAREAFDAAADHVSRILGPVAHALDLLVLGGDRPGVLAVLEHRQLALLSDLERQWIAGVADPRRGVLDAVIEQARSLKITVADPLPH